MIYMIQAIWVTHVIWVIQVDLSDLSCTSDLFEWSTDLSDPAT